MRQLLHDHHGIENRQNRDGITGLFYAMEASASGRRHDNAVLQGSILYNRLKNGNLPFEGAKIARDAAYTSDLPFMAIPFPDREVKHSQAKKSTTKLKTISACGKGGFQSFKMESSAKV